MLTGGVGGGKVVVLTYADWWCWWWEGGRAGGAGVELTLSLVVLVVLLGDDLVPWARRSPAGLD